MLKKVLNVVLVMALMLTSFNLNVFAQEEMQIEQLECQVRELETVSDVSARSTTFVDTTITTGYDSDGMHVTIVTCMNQIASVVGIKDIKIQVQNGNEWVTVAVSSGGELNNTRSCAVDLNYTGVVVGYTYRVTCVHYGDVDGYRELYHETDGFKCQYQLKYDYSSIMQNESPIMSIKSSNTTE